MFEADPSQWTDSDEDGYGDNPSPASMPDYCPNEWGNSTMSLLGCPDSDGDGWSDEGDYYPSDSSRHSKSLPLVVIIVVISVLVVSVAAFVATRRR